MSFIRSLYPNYNGNDTEQLNPDAEPFYPPGEEPVQDNSVNYRTHTLTFEDDSDCVTDSKSEYVSGSDSDSDSDSGFSSHSKSISGSDSESDSEDECIYCEQPATKNSQYCALYELLRNHYGEDDRAIDCANTSCEYPNCDSIPDVFVEESKYADAGFYCTRHMQVIDAIMLEDLTLELALEDSKLLQPVE